MLSTIHMHTGEESSTVVCGSCGDALDPGEAWADDAPWNDAQALSAAERRGWVLDVADNFAMCPPCVTETDAFLAAIVAPGMGPECPDRCSHSVCEIDRPESDAS